MPLHSPRPRTYVTNAAVTWVEDYLGDLLAAVGDDGRRRKPRFECDGCVYDDMIASEAGALADLLRQAFPAYRSPEGLVGPKRGFQTHQGGDGLSWLYAQSRTSDDVVRVIHRFATSHTRLVAWPTRIAEPASRAPGDPDVGYVGVFSRTPGRAAPTVDAGVPPNLVFAFVAVPVAAGEDAGRAADLAAQCSAIVNRYAWSRTFGPSSPDQISSLMGLDRGVPLASSSDAPWLVWPNAVPTPF